MKVDYSEVRRLLRLGAAGALGTHSASLEGYPFASSLPYALDGACRPLFLISGLAEHTRNLLADPRASLLVLEGEGGRLDQARVTLLGRVLPVTPDEDLQARYLRYQPEAAAYPRARGLPFLPHGAGKGALHRWLRADGLGGRVSRSLGGSSMPARMPGWWTLAGPYRTQLASNVLGLD